MRTHVIPHDVLARTIERYRAENRELRRRIAKARKVLRSVVRNHGSWHSYAAAMTTIQALAAPRRKRK